MNLILIISIYGLKYYRFISWIKKTSPITNVTIDWKYSNVGFIDFANIFSIPSIGTNNNNNIKKKDTGRVLVTVDQYNNIILKWTHLKATFNIENIMLKKEKDEARNKSLKLLQKILNVRNIRNIRNVSNFRNINN